MPVIGPTIDHREIRAWADRHQVLPTEQLPCLVDHEPTVLELMSARELGRRDSVRVLEWDEFFARFDLLGLAFVYNEDQDSYHELLQREEANPHYGTGYRKEAAFN